jgi:hypothetical protein
MSPCLHCGKLFKPRRGGHVFCSVRCRHLGERKPHEPLPADPEVIDRLFDPRRDPEEFVRDDDWFAPADAAPEWKALYAGDTVAKRRRWFGALADLGRV